MKKKNRLFWGLLFIALAVLLIVSQLGLLNFQIDVMTLLLTVFFGIWALWSLFHKRPTGFLFSLAFLSILYDRQLGIEEITPWTVLLAALLGSIGCHFLFSSQQRDHQRVIDIEDTETVDQENVDVEVHCGTSIKYITTQNLKSVHIQNFSGFVKVYFDGANIQDKAVIQLHMTCAKLEIYIPKTWEVIDQTDCMLSHLEMEMASSDLITHQVVLQGKVNLSYVKIIYI